MSAVVFLSLQEVSVRHDKSHRVANHIRHIQSKKQDRYVDGWETVAREEQDRTLLLHFEHMTEHFYGIILYWITFELKFVALPVR
jgi:hypothetical protein